MLTSSKLLGFIKAVVPFLVILDQMSLKAGLLECAAYTSIDSSEVVK